jgi:restriction system protein
VSPEYLSLAKKRLETRMPPHRQPEDFGYSFHEWVSPYTKGAHKTGSIALVLQDWASSDGLDHSRERGWFDSIQEHGRAPNLLTNRRLAELLHRVFGLAFSDVYATNVFPFVKIGGMSNSIPTSDLTSAAKHFATEELSLAQPRIILALGVVAHSTLRTCGVASTHLPHPAARIGGTNNHEDAWRAALQGRVAMVPRGEQDNP